MEPLSDIAIALLDKIEKATGWVFSTITSQKEGYKSIIEEISKMENINPIERAIIISNFKKIMKEHKNKGQIVSKAVELLENNAKPENINDDWLCRFFDLCKDISDEQLQKVWAKILANQCNENKKSSLKLLRTISDITKPELVAILKIAKNVNYEVQSRIGMLFAGTKFLEGIDIKYDDFIMLEEIGIIKKETLAFEDGEKLSFDGKKYILKEQKQTKLKLKRVMTFIRFTDVGMEILGLAQVETNNEISELFKKAISEQFELIELNDQ